MAISSAGIGSGLDVNSIVSQLVNVEKQPLKLLQNKAAGLQSTLSAYGSVKSVLAGLQDAAKALLNTDTWKGKTFTSNNTAVVTGSASSTALATSFSLEVTNLAQTQSIRSAASTVGAAVGTSGRVDIELGQWAGATFTPGSASAISVDISATDTLTQVASKINGKSAGVTAVVVRNGGNEQLLIRGNNTGDAAGFQIKAFEPDPGDPDAPYLQVMGNTGLGKFSYYDDTTPLSDAVIGGMTRTQAAQNANILVDGINVSTATNTVKDAVPGITLNLLAKTTAAAQITVGTDTEGVKAKLDAFVTAYNKVNSTLADLTKYDAASKKAGSLQGDSTAVGLQNLLRSMLGANGPAGTSIKRLSDIGMEVQRGGALTIDSTKLAAAMQDMSSLGTFFTATGGSNSSGMARRINDFVTTANGVGGQISTRSSSLQNAIRSNGKDQDRMNDHIAKKQAQLYAQFNALDTKMGSLSSLGSFMNQQVSNWNKG